MLQAPHSCIDLRARPPMRCNGTASLLPINVMHSDALGIQATLPGLIPAFSHKLFSASSSHPRGSSESVDAEKEKKGGLGLVSTASQCREGRPWALERIWAR